MGVTGTGRWREPVLAGMTSTREQISWARCRPVGQRTEPPRIGEVVGLRLAVYGPVVRARVLSAGMAPPADTRPGAEIDWNVWRYRLGRNGAPIERDALGNREIELVDDPWPSVLVETIEGPKLRTETREARLPGSPGWLREKE